MLTPAFDQDFNPAFYAACGCTICTGDVIAGHRGLEGQLKESAMGRENEADVANEWHDGSDEWALLDQGA